MWRSFVGLIMVLGIALAALPAFAQNHPIVDLIVAFPNSSEAGLSAVPHAGHDASGSYFTRMFTGRDPWCSLPLGIAALAIVLVVAFKTVRNLFRRRDAEPTEQQD